MLYREDPDASFGSSDLITGGRVEISLSCQAFKLVREDLKNINSTAVWLVVNVSLLNLSSCFLVTQGTLNCL